MEAARLASWPVPSQAIDLLMARPSVSPSGNPRVLAVAHSFGIQVRDTRFLPDTVAGWYDTRFTGVGWPLTQRLLLELREHAGRRGAPLALLVIPSGLQVDAGFAGRAGRARDGRPPILAFLRDPHRPQRILGDFCHAAALPCADPLPAALEAVTRGERHYYPIDGHWTPTAHRNRGEARPRAARARAPAPNALIGRH